MKKMHAALLLGAILLGSVTAFATVAAVNYTPAPAAEPEDLKGMPLSMEDFVMRATRKDTVFEQILIDELLIQYRKDLYLPPGDIVLSLKSDYDFVLIQDQDAPSLEISLSKLFPNTGTEIKASYGTSPEFISNGNKFSREDNRNSEYEILISQPIAENAFGKVTRLRDKIIGLENEVIQYQVVEAYEDYLAAVLTAYLDWYEAYENLKVAESSYRQNLKLLENIKKRRESNIALPIDVNKITLQVMAREEVLIESRIRYQNAANIVNTAIRYDGSVKMVPAPTELYSRLDPTFQEDYAKFKSSSRTYHILDLLERSSSFEVDKNANELLPSINLRFGIRSSWDGAAIDKEENILFAGVSMDWPFPDEVERAQYETSKIERERAGLNTVNTHYRLYTDIRNLYQQIDREKRLIGIAEKKIEVAEAILEDETENYTFGKVTLNDYIDAVNDLDNSRFNLVFHEVQLKKFIIETMRLMDRLIDRSEIEAYRQQ